MNTNTPIICQTVKENKTLIEAGFFPNHEEHQEHGWKMIVYTLDTEAGRLLIIDFDAVCHNLYPGYRLWVNSIANIYREGYTVTARIQQGE